MAIDGEDALVVEVEGITDLGHQDGEGRAVEFVDDVEGKQDEQRERSRPAVVVRRKLARRTGWTAPGRDHRCWRRGGGRHVASFDRSVEFGSAGQRRLRSSPAARRLDRQPGRVPRAGPRQVARSHPAAARPSHRRCRCRPRRRPRGSAVDGVRALGAHVGHEAGHDDAATVGDHAEEAVAGVVEELAEPAREEQQHEDQADPAGEQHMYGWMDVGKEVRK